MPKHCCKIGDSPIHGRGVFASKNISMGQMITSYGNTEVDPNSDYAMTFPDGIHRGGHPDLATLSECGFLMNDGYKLTIDEHEHSLKTVNRRLDEYDRRSEASCIVGF